tara:strand:- start:1883 stop:2284 length:402 start_codon:yes stop_codon:yes gene_type:complete
MNAEKKIRKGALVRLNKNVCFTTKEGGGLRFPLTNYSNDKAGIVESSRPVTAAETAAWYDSDASKGMNSAGETKLPPQSRRVTLHKDRIYTVLRARCRVRLGYGNPTPGLAKILCTETGEETYIKRHLLEVVS